MDKLKDLIFELTKSFNVRHYSGNYNVKREGDEPHTHYFLEINYKEIPYYSGLWYYNMKESILDFGFKLEKHTRNGKEKLEDGFSDQGAQVEMCFYYEIENPTLETL